MATDDFSVLTVEIKPGRNGRIRYPAPQRPVREKVTMELRRPSVPAACPDRTMELGECDIEELLPRTPPPPPTLRDAPPTFLSDEDFLPLGAQDAPLGDLEGIEPGERGLRGVLRRLLFRLGWLRLDDDPSTLPLATPSRWPLRGATGTLRG